MAHHLSSRHLVSLGLALVLGLAAGLSFRCRPAAETRDEPPGRGPAAISPGACAPALDRRALDESLALGVRFLLAHQLSDGNFDYEYDWVKKTFTPDDSQVRQAGAAWGLALVYHDQPGDSVGAALDRALDFFARHSARARDGARYVVYPGEREGELGTVALVALAHADYLRGGARRLPRARADTLRAHLDQYLAFLLAARREAGGFHAQYAIADGAPHGDPSPYFDGEALLALVKAARHLGRDDLVEVVRAEADAGHRRHNLEARRVDPDSDVTKGYYQWSSMVYFELATSGWDDVTKYEDWLIELADWMIDTHRTLQRTRNTGYAYEGIVPAYAVAALRGDSLHASKFACTIERGLAKLTSWQVGHRLANEHVLRFDGADPLAIGGIQNHAREPALRIDVTQHQMHAVILARRHYYVADAR